MEKRGNLSINSENMFPIIKKWLYSDHDIFYREVVSNACDAITKIRKMDMMGEYTLPDGFKPRVDIVLNDKEKTIKIIDNGIGMTADEVEEYINQVAFSGATDFLNKYKDKANADQIIGHFGLGFYSTFMVSDYVDIDTLSYKSDAASVHWTCDGGSDFEMSDGDKKEIGTTITLHLSDDCLEFCNEYKAREVIEKYCSFMPYEIYLSRENEEGTETIKESEKRDDDVVIEVIEPEKKEEAKSDSEKDGEASEEKKEEERKLKIRRRPQLLNDTHPLWAKTPKDCTDEEYKEFYRKVFRDYKEPLFWIHLNMDYPFNLKGILYFPKINMEFESAEGVIKLYNNQVFIADNIKEVIPEYLMLLKGVIDCPDLPLNVSRSALQNDGFVKKISDYISKKVAEKLAGLCKTDKENYDKYWEDISPFIKYGCLKDDKFCEKMNDYILFKNLDGKYLTLPDALQINKEAEEAAAAEEAKDENGNKVEAEVVDENGNTVSGEESDNADSKDAEKEKEPRIIYYVTDEQQQSQYINMFKAQKMDAFILNHNIDVPFIQQLESKNQDIRFQRIDADLTDTFKSKTSKKAEKEFEEIEKNIGEQMKKALKNEQLVVKIERLKDKKISSMLTVSEETRRMQDMMKMYAANGMMMGDLGMGGQTLILNANHPLVKYVMENKEGDNVNTICEQLYDLARIQNAPLDAESMTKFVQRSNDIMMLLAK
ncbi:molecular chaperone HtpG [Butyrivibrio sp. WCE2006]|uniref:molecular chaperone HtpG n=1 Tax=Butyrivibrio sp. WCE2006 TaxID=1410611 RepID=UPI0005D14384|nr:molecular chaperone HtpG [Butyrivibrio sp. WCE2006]